jgi:hypothetical protein
MENGTEGTLPVWPFIALSMRRSDGSWESVGGINSHRVAPGATGATPLEPGEALVDTIPVASIQGISSGEFRLGYHFAWNGATEPVFTPPFVLEEGTDG